MVNFWSYAKGSINQKATVQRICSGLDISYCEDMCEFKRIEESGTDALWVGLGVPKQEKWMAEHIEKINVPLSSNSLGELKEKIATILDNEDLAVRQGAWSQECITGKFAFQEYIDRNKALRDL